MVKVWEPLGWKVLGRLGLLVHAAEQLRVEGDGSWMTWGLRLIIWLFLTEVYNPVPLMSFCY